ncbi:MAG: radical SAM protein [Candidatus Odinarchaeia archaeon]
MRGSKYGENTARTFSVKVNAPQLLEKQLSKRARKGEYGFIMLSTSTDPYVPIEEELKLTRKLLELILKYRFPVEVATKSKLVLRDLDILKEIDQKAVLPSDLKSKLKHGVIITFSISTLNKKLAKILKPGASTPEERLATMQKCKREGFLVGVSFIPVLPFLSDSEEQLDKMIKTAKDYEADLVFVGGLTLFGKGPADCKILHYKFLEKHHPELISKYNSLFKGSYAPLKEYQRHLELKAKRICEKHGIRKGIL